MSSALDRLKNLTAQISSYELERKSNLKRLDELYQKLKIDEKISTIDELFDLKAINLSGVSLDSENIGKIQEGKYVQIIGIKYDSNARVKSKNISIGYFGRAEKLSSEMKKDIVTFVMSYRFEKSFRALEHYYNLLGTLK